MRQMWNMPQIKQCELETGQALLQQEQLLVAVNQDFGGLAQGQAAAVCIPANLPALQSILRYATAHQLPVTIRGKGLSQSGQSLAPAGALCIDVSQLNSELKWKEGTLVAGCSTSWKAIISQSLSQKKLPPVTPYNTNLTLGGVLSVGGLGSTSFKEGIIASHIDKLTVVTATGDLLDCDSGNNADLFDGCLSGVGLFGVIYEAVIALRPCMPMVRTYMFTYTDYSVWIEDQFILKHYGDYLEAFIMLEPSDNPIERICIINMGIEYDDSPPDVSFFNQLGFSSVSDAEDKPLLNYLYRHDGRLQQMRESGDWAAAHPWYECYVDSQLLIPKLDEILGILGNDFGGMYHVFPVAAQKPRFFMLPEEEKVVTFNVLAPGIDKAHTAQALQSLLKIDKILMAIGGKRYISGWFAASCEEDYWLKHYGSLLVYKNQIKANYDPGNIFCSTLFPN